MTGSESDETRTPRPLPRTLATVPHDLIEPLDGLRVVSLSHLVLLFDLFNIFWRSVGLMSDPGKEASEHLFGTRRMVNSIRTPCRPSV